MPEGWYLADALRAAGTDEVLAPFYAAGATSRDLNLVLWRWNAGSSATVTVTIIDDFGRLPSPPAKP